MHDHLIRASLVFALATGFFAGPVFAQQAEDAPEIEELPAMDAVQEREKYLDALFERLADPDANDWRRVQSEIAKVWSDSGSASMNLLFRRAAAAMEKEDYDTALLFLNDLTRLAPDFAEGWNRRATLYFQQGDYSASLEDIARTLRLEPRHFAALSGLGIILDRIGDDAGALEAFRRVIEINPHITGAHDGIKKLTPEVEGRRL